MRVRRVGRRRGVRAEVVRVVVEVEVGRVLEVVLVRAVARERAQRGVGGGARFGLDVRVWRVACECDETSVELAGVHSS